MFCSASAPGAFSALSTMTSQAHFQLVFTLLCEFLMTFPFHSLPLFPSDCSASCLPLARRGSSRRDLFGDRNCSRPALLTPEHPIRRVTPPMAAWSLHVSFFSFLFSLSVYALRSRALSSNHLQPRAPIASFGPLLSGPRLCLSSLKILLSRPYTFYRLPTMFTSLIFQFRKAPPCLGALTFSLCILLFPPYEVPLYICRSQSFERPPPPRTLACLSSISTHPLFRHDLSVCLSAGGPGLSCHSVYFSGGLPTYSCFHLRCFSFLSPIPCSPDSNFKFPLIPPLPTPFACTLRRA